MQTGSEDVYIENNFITLLAQKFISVKDIYHVSQKCTLTETFLLSGSLSASKIQKRISVSALL